MNSRFSYLYRDSHNYKTFASVVVDGSMYALHDKAFDGGLLTIDDDWRVVLSSGISDHPIGDAEKDLLVRFEGTRIELPARFRPDPAFLSYHRDRVFQG